MYILSEAEQVLAPVLVTGMGNGKPCMGKSRDSFIRVLKEEATREVQK